METVKIKRRWFRYSLRTLMMLVTIACVGFGWLGMKVRQAQRQKEAVDSLREFGVQVFYDYQLDANGGMLASFDLAVPPGPVWLRRLLGDDFFVTVRTVAFYGPQHFGDPQVAGKSTGRLTELLELAELKELALAETNVQDTDLAHLHPLKQLRYLNLRGTQITDAGLSHLHGLAHLAEIDLSFARRVTDTGCQELQKALPNLKILR